MCVCVCKQAESQACVRPLGQAIEVVQVNLPYEGTGLVLDDDGGVRHVWRG